MSHFQQTDDVLRDSHIDGWNVRIYYWSRDLRVLAAVAALVLGVSAAVGWQLRTDDPLAGIVRQTKEKVSLKDELAKQNPDLSKVIQILRLERFNRSAVQNPLAVTDLLQRSTLPAEAKPVAAAYWDSLTKCAGEPNADLLYQAHYVHPLPLANELVGDLHRGLGHPGKAQLYYEREIRFTGADSARKKEVELLIAARDANALGLLATDPHYQPFFPREAKMELAAHDRRWADLVQPLNDFALHLFEPMPVTLAIVGALVWMLIAFQSVQPERLVCFRSTIPWLALLAGAASTWPTLFAVSYEAEVFGLRNTGDFLGDVLFFVAGVGVREELIKLLFFLPFVPILLWRRSRLEMLIVAGCVGLGFAGAENLVYFNQAGPSAAFVRFLTANFFHLAATGVVGLAFCDALTSPLKNGLRFVGVLLAVMFVHGCYDAFISVHELRVLSLVSMMAFLLLSLYFFRQLGVLRNGLTDQIAISATLILGMAVLTGTIFVCASATLGFAVAGMTLAASALGLVMVVYMFYWQLGEGISSAAHSDEENHHSPLAA